jgi:hypothetical protein
LRLRSKAKITGDVFLPKKISSGTRCSIRPQTVSAFLMALGLIVPLSEIIPILATSQSQPLQGVENMRTGQQLQRGKLDIAQCAANVEKEKIGLRHCLCLISGTRKATQINRGPGYGAGLTP